MTQMVDHFKEAMCLLIAAPIHLKGAYHAKHFSNGELVPHENITTANCFCAAGALYRAAGIDPSGNWLPIEYINMLDFNREGDVVIWNDNSDKNEVLTRFAETINKLEKM
jgi:hypothetical protein